jgi:probable O-glycosylation ligase (exosortase A-associated)
VPIRGVILFALLLGSLPACFVWPFYGILVWSVVAFLNPQSSLFYWSAALNFPWAMAVAVPTLGGLFFVRGWTRRLACREVYIGAVLWIWFTVTSEISSQDPLFMHHAAQTWYKWGFVSKILLMTAVTVVVVDSFERLRVLVIVIAGCFGYYVLKSLPFIIMTGGQFRIYGPEFSMIADNNDFGLALNMTLPMFFFLARTETRRWARWLCGFLFVIGIPAVFFTYSRGAMVGLIAIAALMLLQLKQRFLLIPVIGLGLVTALVFAPASWRDRMDPTSPNMLDASALERLNAWAFARNLAADYPIAGGGFDTFTHQLFARYAPQGNDVHGPHSIYFQMLGEHGYVGLFLYLALILSCFASLFQTSRLGKKTGDTIVCEYSKMFRFSFVSFLASGAFLGRAYFDYFYSIIACVVVLKLVARDRYEQAIRDAEYGQPDREQQQELMESYGG